MGQYTKLTIDNGIARLRLDRAANATPLKRETLEGDLRCGRRDRGGCECPGVCPRSLRSRFLRTEWTWERCNLEAESANGRSEWVRDSRFTAKPSRRFSTSPSNRCRGQRCGRRGWRWTGPRCDLVVATRSAFFFLPEPMRESLPRMVTPLLIHRVGPGPAGQLLLSGERWTAENGPSQGAMLDVVEDDQLDLRSRH